MRIFFFLFFFALQIKTLIDVCKRSRREKRAGEKKKTFNATDRNKITVELKSWGQREG